MMKRGIHKLDLLVNSSARGSSLWCQKLVKRQQYSSRAPLKFLHRFRRLLDLATVRSTVHLTAIS